MGDNNGTITAAYATGPVSGGSDTGGLAGHNGGTITASYFDTDASGQTAAVGGGTAAGAGHTSAGLQTPINADANDAGGIYETWSADTWDFGDDDQYPVLKADLDADDAATWQEFGYQLRERPDADRHRQRDLDFACLGPP